MNIILLNHNINHESRESLFEKSKDDRKINPMDQLGLTKAAEIVSGVSSDIKQSYKDTKKKAREGYSVGIGTTMNKLRGFSEEERQQRREEREEKFQQKEREREEKKQATRERKQITSELSKGKASEETTQKVKNDIQNKINEIDDGKQKELLNKSMEYADRCSENPAYYQKALKLAMLQSFPDLPTYEGFVNVMDGTGMLGNYTLTYTSKLINFFIPRAFHSINKLLNIFEYHNLGAVFLAVYSRLISEEIVTLKEKEDNIEKTIKNRLKYVEQILMELHKKQSFKSIKEEIKRVILYGYMNYDLQINKLDNLEPVEKYYLKIFAVVVKNLRIKNQLIDMLEKFYLNNTEASRYSLSQKNIWFKRYYSSLNLLSKKYKFKKYNDLKNDHEILLFNNYISYSESMYILVDPQKAGFFLIGNNNKTTNIKKQQGGNNKLKIKSLDEFINNNIELIYNKQKIIKKRKLKNKSIVKNKIKNYNYKIVLNKKKTKKDKTKKRRKKRHNITKKK